MAVIYQHEYVSGSVPVQNGGFDATVLVSVVNRGPTAEHVRARFMSGHTLLFDSGDEGPQDVLSRVAPHSTWGRNKELPHIDPNCDMYWFQIFTTSTSLVPSAGDGNVLSDNPMRFPYLGSGDFAHFLHVDGIRVPIGPKKE